MQAPLVQALKKWNWQKYYMKKLLAEERETLRSKQVEPCKDRQISI
jgi:hypothetical protein